MPSAAGLEQAIFYSGGCRLLGGFYRAAGESPRPTAILLHGVPGLEKNLDIAYALRDAGWNCLYFHYRGCWGSQGDYSFLGLVDDVRAATDWLVQHPAVDAARLALVGSSMGGYTTVAAGAADPRFRALVPMCPLVDPHDVPLGLDTAREFASMLHGVTGEQLLQQWAALPPLQTMAGDLAGRPMLLVSGDRDEYFSPDHMWLLVDAVPGVEWKRFPDADHVFSRDRRQLVAVVIDWLVRNVPL